MAAGQVPQVSLDSDFENALGVAGLSSRTAVFDPGLLRLFRAGDYPTPLYESCNATPWRIPFLMDVTRRELAATIGKPSDSLNSLGRLAGFGTRRTLIGNPIQYALDAAAKPGALGEVLRQMRAEGLIGASPGFSGVPAQTQQAATIILQVALRARSIRNLALSGMANPEAAFTAIGKGSADEANAEGVSVELAAYKGFKTNYMAAAAHDLLLACQEAEDLLSKVPAGKQYDFRIRTIWGVLELTGGRDETHSDSDTFLLLDTGGNDTYVNCPANGGITNWCSIVIDTAGSDHYLSDEALANTTVNKWSGRRVGGSRPGPAGALFGIAVLIDSAGDDVYRTHRPGLGSGRLGVGVLLDKGGNDTYDAYQDSEGFGMFGAGILEDESGRDVYRGFTQVQGCGQTGGVGFLVDRVGDDEYISEDQVIDFPSPQSAQHNVSMSQGAGNGRRADYLEGESLAGGVGILYDGSGNDKYTCGVFGQGAGYWEGVGSLWDEGGVDTYTGQWYVQGAAAHFAIGYLDDMAGNDTYIAPMNMAQGAGHDFSIGMLVERGGDDKYTAPNLSLGAGNANGMGVFVDMAGNDVYSSSGVTLGKAAEAAKGSLRQRALCLGVFLDLGGSDTYPPQATWARNGTQGANWTDHAPTPGESQVGIFVDR